MNDILSKQGLQRLAENIRAKYETKEALPKKTSELANDSSFETLSGLNSKIESAISGVTEFDYTIVVSLPQEGQKGVIYLVPNQGTGQNIYDEYIWIVSGDPAEGRFELFGTKEIEEIEYVGDETYITITDGTGALEGKRVVSVTSDVMSKLQIINSSLQGFSSDGETIEVTGSGDSKNLEVASDIVEGANLGETALQDEDVDYISSGYVDYLFSDTIVPIPTVTVGTYTYNGNEQGPTISWQSPEDAQNCTVANATKVDGGTYELSISLKDPTAFWTNGTNAPLSFEYTIGRATAPITLSDASITLDKNNLSKSVSVSNVNGRVITMPSTSDSTVATASVSENIVTVSSVNKTKGTATITITALQNSNYEASSATVSVTCDFIELDIVPFETATYKQMQDMLNAYYNDEITWQDMGWNVGDTKKIRLASTSGPTGSSGNIANQLIQIVIIGHDHTDLAEPINGHTKSCVTVQFKEVPEGTDTYVNGSSDYDGTGIIKWSTSYIRNYLNSNLRQQSLNHNDGTLAFNNLIKQSKHYRHVGYVPSGDTADELVTDYLFLPSYPEIFGRSFRYYEPTVHTEGTQFEYFANDASNITKYMNNNGSPSTTVADYWTGSRSQHPMSTEDYGDLWIYVANRNSVASESMSYGNTKHYLAPAWAM